MIFKHKLAMDYTETSISVFIWCESVGWLQKQLSYKKAFVNLNTA